MEHLRILTGTEFSLKLKGRVYASDNMIIESGGIMKIPRKQTENFLNGWITIVFNLLQPSLDACERLNSTDIVDNNYTMSAAVEPAAKSPRLATEPDFST